MNPGVNPGMNRRAGRGRAAAAALLLAMLACGCSTLPTTGAVHTRPDASATAGEEAPYFEPPGPRPGADRADVVRGFLLAMQANPPSTIVARSFLSARARATWKPVNGTVVYDASDFGESGDVVTARLSDAHRLDPHGVWAGGSAGSTLSIPYALVRENGQWRIDDPPNALAVPASYFQSLFVPFHLYFFDRTGTVLVPVRVYLPRGEQTATNLVRGLLAGPPPTAAGAVTSAFPVSTSLDIAVLVSDAGVAEVPLGQSVLRMPAGELQRALVQLAWTLRQVPGITRIRVTTVDGAVVPLPQGVSDISAGIGPEFDPTTMPDRTLVALVGHRLVRIGTNGTARVGGPLGGTEFALRSVALDAARNQVAAVSANGRRLYLASDLGAASSDQVRVPIGGAADLLRPVYDRFGSLWTIDRTAHGAVVHVVTGGVDRVLRIPGISGRQVVAFTVTRDGARFVTVYAGAGVPRLGIAGLARLATGRVQVALPAEQVSAGEAGLGEVRDVAQIDQTTLGVLTQPAHGSGWVVQVELDGSPGQPDATPLIVPASALTLTGSPDPLLPLRVVTTDHRLLLLDTTGRWTRSPLADVRAVSYPG